MNKEGHRLVRHKQTASEMDGASVMVQFSPEVVRGFTRLEAAVHKSKHFSPEILENLQAYTEGKPLTVHNAITAIAFVTKETMRHVHETGDTRAKEALDDLTLALIEDSRKPVRLLKPPLRGR
jgi:hypothetical protein